MPHPNAAASGLSGGVAALAVYLLNTYAGTHLNPVDGAGIATALGAAVLFIGRRGIKGAVASLWRGSDKPAGPPPAPPPAA